MAPSLSARLIWLPIGTTRGIRCLTRAGTSPSIKPQGAIASRISDHSTPSRRLNAGTETFSKTWRSLHNRAITYSREMSTSVQQNWVSKNQQYASSVTEGDLASPPAKKYAVGKSCKQRRFPRISALPYEYHAPSTITNLFSSFLSDLHGRPH